MERTKYGHAWCLECEFVYTPVVYVGFDDMFVARID